MDRDGEGDGVRARDCYGVAITRSIPVRFTCYMLKSHMTKTMTWGALFSIVLASGAIALAGTPSAQTHRCKLPDGSVDPVKTHKQCDKAKGAWTADPAKPATSTPSTPSTPSKDPTASATPGKDAAKSTPATKPSGDTTQTHHCRMPDKSMDLKKTHKECDAAKGEWAKDASKPATAPHAP